MSLVRNGLPAIVTLMMVLAFGLFGATLVTRVGYLAVPSSIGLPYGLPGLRVVPLGETTWLTMLTESVAALVLVVFVAATRGGFWRTWGAFLLGTLVADLLRAAVLFQESNGAGIGTYGAYLAGGLLAGLVWGLGLGWIAGLATLARRTRAGEDAGRTPVTASTSSGG
ncbi:hypothetical protein ACIBHX_50855 [Nonomuraea sp. NPDC050536]|uniref:hypothetical protein n=1 Tax=Nonomuraea sp. NPDC050536 TaxID=3364366 RepID=UPI0037C9711A